MPAPMLATIRACALLLLGLIAGPSLAAGTVQTVQIPGGPQAWLVEDHAIPVISVSLAFRGGALLDPSDQQGISRLGMGLLDEGAGDRDSQAFKAFMAEHAIRLDFSSGRESLTIQLKTTVQEREAGFALLQDAVTRPRFAQAETDRVRRQIVQDLERDAVEPSAIAGRLWQATAYPDHPYSRSTRGTRAGLEAVTPEILKAWSKQRFTRRSLVIGVAGAITPAETAELLGRLVAALPEGTAPVRPPVTSAKGAGQVKLVRRQVPQTIMLFGLPGLLRADPDYLALTLVNQVLGGGSFTSRLGSAVRDKRGLAYGIGSQASYLDSAGEWIGSTQVRNAQAGAALDVIREEIGRMAKDGVTPEELDDAKSYLIGSIAVGLDSVPRVADYLVGQQLAGLPSDYLDRRSDLIRAVTLEQANAVARRLLDPARLLVVAVGDPTGIQAVPPSQDGQ